MNLNVFEENTTGESPFSSPRLFGESEDAKEEPELKNLKTEVKENRQIFIKTALGLGDITTLDESYIERDE